MRSNLPVVLDGAPPALSLSHLRKDGDEPRIRDLDVAERLGLKQPRNIRQTIEANRAELESYGPLHAENAMVAIGSGAARATLEYWLNEGQALLICMLSRTEKAAMVRRQVIDVFMAYRRRLLPMAPFRAPRPDKALPPPISADELADSDETAPRISETLLEANLGIELRLLIERHRAELLCLGPIDRRGRPRRYWFTEGQALRLCALSGAERSDVVANEVASAFAGFRQRQATVALEQQQTIKALTAELTSLRGAIAYHAAQQPLEDRLVKLEAELGKLRLGRADVSAIARMLGLSNRQRNELGRWIGEVRRSDGELTDSQKRWRRGYFARTKGRSSGKGGRAHS